MRVEIDKIVAHPDVQARARGVVKAVVEQYAEAMKGGAVFPPVVLFHDAEAGCFWLADGFHRFEAVKVNGETSIEADVKSGGKREAILYSVGANASHGLRRTNVDKRRAVEMLLRDPEWARRSDNWIRQTACTDRKVIVRMRAQLGVPRPDAALGRDGRSLKKKKGGYSGSGQAHRVQQTHVDTLRSLLELRPHTLEEACDALSLTPRHVRKIAEELEKRDGVAVSFASNRNERQEYALKLQLRELRDAKAHLLKELHAQAGQLEALMALREEPLEPITARKGIGEGKRRQGTPVLVMSDLHVEEHVQLAKTSGLNEYNPEIAQRCIERCAEAFEWFEKEHHCWDMREAIIAIIGDTFSGWIHAELIEGNFMSPIKAVVWLLPIFVRFFKTVLATTKFDRIIVVLKDGNHGRLTQKIRAATRSDNSLEWLMFHQLAAALADEPRLRFQVDESIYSYVEVYGRTLAFTHGDQWQYMGGVGGLLIPVRRGVNEARKHHHFDTVVMGHFHQYMPLDDVHVNGSAIGITEYSLSKSFPPERRRQSWFLLDSNNWKTANSPVWLVNEPAWTGGHVRDAVAEATARAEKAERELEDLRGSPGGAGDP